MDQEVVSCTVVDSRRSIRIRTPIPLFCILPLLAASVLVLSACASSERAATGTATGAAEVAVLSGVSDLRERFNQDMGKVRLILLISPT